MKLQNEDKDFYRRAVLLVVDDSLYAAMRFDTTPEQKAKIADVWTRKFFGIIPEVRLPDVFELASSLHTSEYPVNAYEMQNAWTQIQEKEAEQRAKQALEQIKNQNPIDVCKNRLNHINGEGRVILPNPLNFSEDIELPCPDCRFDAYTQQRSEFIKKHNQSDNVQIAIETVLESRQRVVSITDQLGKRALKGDGQAHQEWLKKFEGATV